MDGTSKFEQAGKNLIRECKKDCSNDFIDIIQLKREQLTAVAAAIVQTREDAEDVVQTALVKAYDSLKYFRNESQIFTWVYRIVINEAKNKYFQSKRFQGNVALDNLLNVDLSLSTEIPSSSIASLPYCHLCRRELYKLLLRGVRSLPHNMRKAVYLRFFKDYSYEEIAARLHCSIGTVKSRLARGRSQLKKYLQQYQSELSVKYIR